jgi:hypothetical protein
MTELRRLFIQPGNASLANKLMIFELFPYVGAGPVKFGMSRADIQRILEEKCTVFNRGNSKTETDYVESLGIFIEYNEDYECISLEMAQPAVAWFRGKNLLELTRKQILQLLKDDAKIEQDEAGFTSYLLGIGGYCETSRQKAKSIILFGKGYYDGKKEWRAKLDSFDFTSMSSEEIDAAVNDLLGYKLLD